MEASLLYCSVGCGRTPHAISWNRNGVLAFAADRSIALAKQERNVLRVFATLHGHSDRVNCVQWITHRCHDKYMTTPTATPTNNELVSGSVDKTVRVWARKKNEDTYSCVAELSGHTHPITCVTTMYDPLSHDTHVISGAADSTVHLWLRPKEKDSFQLTQTISCGRGFTMCLDCYYVTSSNTSVLICGGNDALVHVYRLSKQSLQFDKVLSLAGHEDWIRDIHITQEDKGDLLIASSSQDTYIRIWRVCKTTPTDKDANELKLEGNIFSSFDEGVEYLVTLETVLLGHDDWVYGVHWQPAIKEAESTTPTQPLCLLSVSMDKTMIIWSHDHITGTWIDQVRMGDVGGNTLGLYGGVFGHHGNVIIAHGYQGAFHMWRREEEGGTRWQPLTTPSGHFGPVQDISWEPVSGRYLISVGSDQTSRLHAPWTTPTQMTWHELARPQVHGYDMQCVAMVTPTEFVSGADEKVLRVFEAPGNFFKSLSLISGCTLEAQSRLPLGASVPSLGLSNKAVFTDTSGDSQSQDSITKNPFADHVPTFSSVEFTEPPLEVDLLQNTLWPETQKLYGHGYELYCVACSPDGKLVASACKASKVEFAAVRIWETKSWSQVALLTHHTLTVTQLVFSHDSSKLLVVSRDRCWSLWNRNEAGMEKEAGFNLIGQMDKSSKAHSRIIWSCTWTHDDMFFVTGSRDKRVCVWHDKGVSGGWSLAATPLELPQAVTAVDFAPGKISKDKYFLAVGLETGEILFVTFNSNDLSWSRPLTINPSLCHSLAVRRLQWKPRPHPVSEGYKELVLASCSTDHSVRLLDIKLKTV